MALADGVRQASNPSPVYVAGTFAASRAGAGAGAVEELAELEELADSDFDEFALNDWVAALVSLKATLSATCWATAGCAPDVTTTRTGDFW